MPCCPLQCADAEVQAGQGGSRAVRAAALAALRRLVVATGSGEALAFFVPGIVRGLGKALGAAGGWSVSSSVHLTQRLKAMRLKLEEECS